MGQAHKRHYDRYTLEFKKTAVRLADLPTVSAIDIADTLGIHVVMLYRWRMDSFVQKTQNMMVLMS